MRHWDYPVIHIAALLVSSSPYTDFASRDAVAKLRLDGTPTPRSWPKLPHREHVGQMVVVNT